MEHLFVELGITESQLATNSCNKENYGKIVSKAQMFAVAVFQQRICFWKKEMNIKKGSTCGLPAVSITYPVNGSIILLLCS